MCGDFGCGNSLKGDTTDIYWVETRGVVKYPKTPRLPQQRIIQPKMLIVPRLRSPALDHFYSLSYLNVNSLLIFFSVLCFILIHTAALVISLNADKIMPALALFSSVALEECPCPPTDSSPPLDCVSSEKWFNLSEFQLHYL